jgi:hypothetical protein
MWPRTFGVVAIITLCTPAFAERLTPQQAKRFIQGNKWSYTCPLTKGWGRFNSDGSVTAEFQTLGFSPYKKNFPPGSMTISSDGSLCMPKMFNTDVCFFVDKIDNRHFRGTSSGFIRFSCDFAAER